MLASIPRHEVMYSSSALSSNCHVRWKDQRFRFEKVSKSSLMPGLKKECSLSSFGRGATLCSLNSNSDAKLKYSGREITSVSGNGFDGVEPFRGKSGSVSFHGLTHQRVEESKLASSPFKEGTGSFLWVLAPVALISSLVLPQFFLDSAIEAILKDEVLAEIVATIFSEAMFYIGLATFLHVTDHVQRPYLQFSPKRWGLITGLKGYLTTAFFTMGFKIFAPFFAVYVTWPVLGPSALVAVAPFLVGCAAQLAFEMRLSKRGSSCWPLVPIIFEVYRLYQLSKAAHFMDILILAMKEAPVTPDIVERSGALVAMVVTFQVLGLVCLWSLMTFLMRLFPSRPVAENY
ncbi:uncharacterized protein LOC117905945 isoform X2 [Vitis riparia]|uniref:uncharacterized protein LOC117905945 isoform X2 n=1 Tax=Vitis riparia TaxID=96939 RepID=UPI00155A5A3B|nr:uncharacterized protein LOC117905945 isoform X2 [Vitis riparia]